MDSVATASGLFVRPACAKSWRWKSYRELTTRLPPVDYPQYKDNASSESFCLIPLLGYSLKQKPTILADRLPILKYETLASIQIPD